jgi:hypothetical protein
MGLYENMSPAIQGGLKRLARINNSDVNTQLDRLLKKAKDWFAILSPELQDGLRSVANYNSRDLDTQLVYSYIDRDTSRWAKLGGTIYESWFQSLLPDDQQRLANKAMRRGVSLDEQIFVSYFNKGQPLGLARGGRKKFIM